MIPLLNQPPHPAEEPTRTLEEEPEFIEAMHIIRDMTRNGDYESMQEVAGRRWVTRELDAALIAAVQGALDGNIVFLRPGGADV